MPDLIIHSRIIAKKAPENTIPRNRLTKLIHENISKNILFISSPAGYGKTTLVQEYLSLFNKKAAWYHVTDDILTFYSFITYLVQSLKQLNKDFGEHVLKVINSMHDSMQFSGDMHTVIITVVGTFINDFLQHFDGEIILVLDDLHNAEKTQWMKPALESLTEECPDNLHVIITSRNIPQFDTSKLKAKRNFFELTSNDLLFNNAETEQVIKNIYGLRYSTEDIKSISGLLKGWITGIHLMLQAFGKEFYKAKLENNGLPETLFNFFANDIFKKLSETTQYFLLNTALVDNFDLEICENFLQIKNSREIIKELVNKNIFIETTQINIDKRKILSQHYNYHALFKQYLLTKLYETKTRDEIISLAGKLSGYYKNKKDMEKAIKYSLMANDYLKSIELIRSSFQQQFDNGRFEILWKWFEMIPENIFESDGEMLFCKGLILKYYKGDRNTSLSYFSKAVELTDTFSNPGLHYNCIMQKCECLTNMGRPDESIAILNKALKENTGDENRVKLLFFLADSYYRIGYEKYDEIIRILNEGLEISSLSGIRYITTEIHNLLGNVYHDRGDFIKSLFYFELAERNESNVYKKFRTLTNIVFLYSYSGNYSEAHDYIEKAKDIFKTYNTLIFEKYLIRAEASLRFECGDYEEAIRFYENLIKLDEAASLNQYLFWYYLFIGECYYFLGETDKARQIYELAINYKSENNEYEDLEYNLHKAINNKKEYIDSDIERVLLNALSYFQKNNLIHSRVQIEFHLADFYFRNNNPERSLQYLFSSLNTSSEKKYISFLEQLFFDFRYLFDFAYESNVQRGFVSSIPVNIIEKTKFKWLSKECKERDVKNIEKIYDITLKTFGNIEILVRGKRIQENKWVRKKSKQVLIYLLIHPHLKYSKEKIIDVFFREHSPESAENLYHQVITNIRNAADLSDSSNTKIISREYSPPKTKLTKSKINQNNKKSSAFAIVPDLIIYEDKVLKLNTGCLIYVDSEEFDKLYNKFKSANTDEENKITVAENALNLYKGEFLPGNYDSWCEELRQSFINRALEMGESLIKLLKKDNQFEKIIPHAQFLLNIDHLNEIANLNLIEAFCNVGKVNQAKNVFKYMLKLYDEEYGEKPDSSILDSIGKILNQYN